MGVFKRNGNWWIDYYDGSGRRHRKKIGPQKAVADLALKDVQVKVARGEYLGIYEEKKIPFREFARLYLDRYAKANLKVWTYRRCEGIVENHLIPYFDWYVCKITKEKVEAYKAQRAALVKPATINRELSRLRHMLQKAVDWGYLKDNPCKGVKELREPSGRIRYLDPNDELDKLIEACEATSVMGNSYNKGRELSQLLKVYLKPIVVTALNTGMRRSELLSLKRPDLNFKQMRVNVEETKNGERRSTPMNKTLYDTLKRLPIRLDTDLVFPGINGNMLSVAFKRACKRAGINDFCFHDLRHTFASYLVMGGVDLRTVQVLLGHKDLRMTMRYAHLSPEHLKSAVTRLDEVFNSDSHYMGTREKERDNLHG